MFHFSNEIYIERKYYIFILLLLFFSLIATTGNDYIIWQFKRKIEREIDKLDEISRLNFYICHHHHNHMT